MVRVSRLHPASEDGALLVTLLNDDVLTCKPLDDSIRIRNAVLGDVPIPFSIIMEIRNLAAVKGKWTCFPIPLRRGWPETPLWGMGADAAGRVWFLSNHGGGCLNGTNFAMPLGGLDAGYNLARMLGGPDRGLYATRFMGDGKPGAINKLLGGTVTAFGDFRFDHVLQVPSLYVTGTGKMYNWGKSFIAVLAGAVWKRHEADLSQSTVISAERGKQMFFFNRNTLYVLGEDDSLEPIRVAGIDPAKASTARIIGAHWGADELMFCPAGASTVSVLDLTTGLLLPAKRINDSLGGCLVDDIARVSDGSVLLAVSVGTSKKRLLARIRPRATAEILFDLAALGIDPASKEVRIPTAHQTPDGAVWMALGSAGVARFNKRALTLFGQKDGLGPGNYTHVVEDANRRLWVGSNDALCLFEPGPTTAARADGVNTAPE